MSNYYTIHCCERGYDPWIDYDEDGDIDPNDLYMLAGEYGSSGDPTKNVNVTNWPEWFSYPKGNMTIVHQTLNVSLADDQVLDPFEELHVSASVDGYKKVTVLIEVKSGNIQWAEARFNIGGIDYVAQHLDPVTSGVNLLLWNYEISGPRITIVAQAYNSATTVSIGLYAVDW